MARDKVSKTTQLNDITDYNSFKTVLLYCSFIVIFPIITFFALKVFILDYLFALGEIKSNLYAAIGAVVALHLGLGLYIYRAYFVTTSPKKVD